MKHAALFIATVYALFGLAMLCGTARAQEAYTVDDTLAAIDEASVEIGVPLTWLYRVVRCETGGTFDPYSIGRQGELGAAQLHPRGKLPTFFRWGYNDPNSPYQAVRFLAQWYTLDGASAWSCAR